MRTFVIIFILATSAYGSDSKKTEKRGLLGATGLGYSGSGYASGLGLGSYSSRINLGPIYSAGYSLSHLHSLGSSTPGYGLGKSARITGITINREVQVPVPVPQPYPVEVIRALPYPEPFPVKVDRPYPVAVPHPVPVEVIRHVPVKVGRPYLVTVPEPIPVSVDVNYRAPYLNIGSELSTAAASVYANSYSGLDSGSYSGFGSSPYSGLGSSSFSGRGSGSYSSFGSSSYSGSASFSGLNSGFDPGSYSGIGSHSGIHSGSFSSLKSSSSFGSGLPASEPHSSVDFGYSYSAPSKKFTF